MADAAVFLDTVALLALANRDDGLHAKARAILNELTAAGTNLITSDWVLTEFLGGASRASLRQAATRIVERIEKSPRVRVIPATRQDWLQGFSLYRERPDKHWSLVDCISFLLCERHAVRQVFTHDRHFVQAGFEVLLK